MKIAIFSDTFYPQINGVSHFAFYMARDLTERGHEVKVFTVLSKKDRKAHDFSRYKFQLKNIPSLPSPVYHGQNFRLAVPAGWTWKEMKKFSPDIIHAHTAFALGIEAAICSRFMNIPLVGEHHTFYDHYLKHIKLDFSWMKKASWKITTGYYNRCDLVITPSQSLADSLISFGLKKPVKVIPNSIDTDFFRPVSPEEKEKIKKSYGVDGLSVVYMGRVSYEKNIDVTLKAFSRLLKNSTDKNIKMMIIGDGPERKKLEKLSRQLSIEKNIIWTGMLRGEKFAQTLAANDVFITASKSENMPLSVVEAMAAGLPMVMVAEKGLKELMRDGVNGYFAKTDNPEDMAKKIKMILMDEKKHREFSQNSRELAMNYSKEKIMRLFEECYQDLINSKKNL